MKIGVLQNTITHIVLYITPNFYCGGYNYDRLMLRLTQRDILSDC